MQHRVAELGAPIQMCDALSRKTPKLSDGVEILLANCLAHYLESDVIQSECAEGHAGRSGIGLNRIQTPDKTSQIIEEREKL